MQSKAPTVDKYLAELPADRRAAIEAVRKLIRDSIDKDFEEGMQYGMIGYYVPHRIYPPGYHCDPKQPLPFAGLASQKNYMSLYLGCLYGHAENTKWFEKEWAKTGKKLDMGKCCVRFRKLDDLAMDLIAEVIRTVRVKNFIEFYEAAIKSIHRRKSKGTTKGTTKSHVAKRGVKFGKTAKTTKRPRKPARAKK